MTIDLDTYWQSQAFDIQVDRALADFHWTRVRRYAMTVTHILAMPGDKKALCGERRDDGAHVLAKFVMDHKRGHGLVTCSECMEVAMREGIALDHE